MARKHGKDANYSWNASALEGELDNIRQDVDVNEAPITAFLDVYQNFLAGKKDVRTELAGPYNAAAVSGVSLFDDIGTLRSTIFSPTGASADSNNPHYKCTASGLSGALVSRYEVNLAVGDAARYTATIQHSGSTTRVVS